MTYTECDITIGNDFPKVISCLVSDGYKEDQEKSKQYLGGDVSDEPLLIEVTALIKNTSDMKYFAYWWYKELQRGRLAFDIELPIYGIKKMYRVKMKNKLSAPLEKKILRNVAMLLEVQDEDIETILETAINNEICQGE